MEPRELPEHVAAKVEEWLSANHSVLYFWEQDGTHFIVSLSRGELYFLRIFPVGGNLELSQDNKVELDLR